MAAPAWLCLLVVPGVYSLAACGGSSPPTKHTGGLGEQCNSDGTCQRGLDCVDGVCVSTYGYGDAIPGDPKGGDPRHGDPSPGDPRPGDARPGDPRPGDSLQGDPAPGDSVNPGDPSAALTCLVGGVARARNVPQVGDLVVTEIYPDPTGADNFREWIEVYVAHGPVDLNDVKIIYTAASPTTKQIVSTDCVAVAQGAYVILGGQNTATDSVTSTVTISNLTLPNSSSVARATVALALGPVTLTTVSYPLPTTEGSSYMLKAGMLDVTSAENQANWCLAGAPNLPFVGIGSPGIANDVCAPACKDGATWRGVRVPAAGNLVITEIYAQPATGTGSYRDWFEVYAAVGPVDLNSVIVANTNATPTTQSKTITGDTCVSVTQGSYAVISGQDVGNDGVSPSVTISSFSLYNSASSLKVSAGGVDIDTVSYPAPTQGKSYQAKPTVLDATGNDNSANWCVAPGAAGDYLPFTGIGTPGAVNPACP